jgi:hypothetical protein
MANQFNYPEPLNGTQYQRPSRLTKDDLEIMQIGEKQVVFGTNDRDVVEIWVYNADGTFAGHLNLRPTSPTLSLTTLVGQDGAHELLNVNVTDVINALNLDPGRYAVTMNFLRDEVGSEEGYRLYISEISDDRTEVRLYPVKLSQQVLDDLYEFTEPSVPRIYAQALIDQTLGFSLDATDADSVSENRLNQELDAVTSGTIGRLHFSQAYSIYTQTMKQILTLTRTRALDAVATDLRSQFVQQADIERYMFTALDQTITEFIGKGIDPRFIFV